jgi:hypothetical protein
MGRINRGRSSRIRGKGARIRVLEKTSRHLPPEQLVEAFLPKKADKDRRNLPAICKTGTSNPVAESRSGHRSSGSRFASPNWRRPLNSGPASSHLSRSPPRQGTVQNAEASICSRSRRRIVVTDWPFGCDRNLKNGSDHSTVRSDKCADQRQPSNDEWATPKPKPVPACWA